MFRIIGICPHETRALPLRRGEADVREMQRALLQTGHAGKGPRGDAIRRPADDSAASGPGAAAFARRAAVVKY